MYIEFDGVAATDAYRGLFGIDEDGVLADAAFVGIPVVPVEEDEACSGTGTATEEENGDVEMAVIELECAWYRRNDCREPMDITC